MVLINIFLLSLYHDFNRTFTASFARLKLFVCLHVSNIRNLIAKLTPSFYLMLDSRFRIPNKIP